MKNRLIVGLKKLKRFYKNLIKVDVFLFVKFNFFTRNIKRQKGALIFPLKGTVIEFGKGSILNIQGDLFIGHNRLKGSKAETLIRIRKNALFVTDETLYIYYNVTIDVFENAKLSIGGGEINCYSAIMCKENIVIGKNVLVARGVYIFDSDFHKTYNDQTNEELPTTDKVFIGDHAWLCVKSTILKGVTIEDFGIVAANKKVQNTIVPTSHMRRV